MSERGNFNPNHIFVDTNVLVGGYSGDARFKRDEACLLLPYKGGERLLTIYSD